MIWNISPKKEIIDWKHPLLSAVSLDLTQKALLNQKTLETDVDHAPLFPTKVNSLFSLPDLSFLPKMCYIRYLRITYIMIVQICCMCSMYGSYNGLCLLLSVVIEVVYIFSSGIMEVISIGNQVMWYTLMHLVAHSNDLKCDAKWIK